MRSYKCLDNQVFSSGNYKIVPLRDEDKYVIMQWRNEQIYHLRQNKPLTKKVQEKYFQETIPTLFEKEQPNQILFSYLENDVCIGYGGLVHINWVDKHAEISFIINTALEKELFEFHWLTYLSLIEQVAFEAIGFHKIFVFAFDLRPHLYQVVEKGGFNIGGGYGVEFNGESSQRVRMVIWNGSSFQRVQANSIIPLNTWTHIAGTFDGATARIYVNGAINVS